VPATERILATLRKLIPVVVFARQKHLSDFTSISRKQLRMESAEAEASHPDADSADVALLGSWFWKTRNCEHSVFLGVDGRVAWTGFASATQTLPLRIF